MLLGIQKIKNLSLSAAAPHADGISGSWRRWNLFLEQSGTYTSCPTTNGGMQKWKLSRNMRTLHARFCHVLAPDLHAQSVLTNNISASELSR